MIENRTCPYCGEYVPKLGDYVTGKQKIKQYFHYECLLKASLGEIKNVKNNSDVRSDPSDPDKLRS